MSKEMFEKGLVVRKEVLGKEYVDRNLANADDFNMPMQEWVTESCWGRSGRARGCRARRAA